MTSDELRDQVRKCRQETGHHLILREEEGEPGLFVLIRIVKERYTVPLFGAPARPAEWIAAFLQGYSAALWAFDESRYP